MNVFISWSKAKSMQFAIQTKELLEYIDPNINAFVSEIDINGGEDVQEKIINRINACDKLILCFTKENKKAPWLLFEAGYARGLSKVVIPILFDNDPNWHSWIDNPMNVARDLKFNDRNFQTTFFKCFNFQETTTNKEKFEGYKKNIIKISESFRYIDIECEDIVENLVQNKAFIKENPLFENRTAYFLTGFESYELLKIVTDSFLYGGKYLWIYGRKNMKLFGGSFNEFFNYLKSKALNDKIHMSGIDFRCMFLDPNSKEVKRAHKQQNIFKLELESSILRAKDVIGDNTTFKKCFRLYSNRREEIIIRIDNCIIYSQPNFDSSGCPQILTNTNFEVFSVFSEKGKECIKKYEQLWLNSIDFD